MHEHFSVGEQGVNLLVEPDETDHPLEAPPTDEIFELGGVNGVGRVTGEHHDEVWELGRQKGGGLDEILLSLAPLNSSEGQNQSRRWFEPKACRERFASLDPLSQ